jgi:hypothetical protein
MDNPVPGNSDKFCRVKRWLPFGFLLVAGCGYSFSGSSLPGHIHSIAVPVLENESLDATIADEVTRGMLDRFLEDNRLKVAGEVRADCVLQGVVSGYERKVYSYTAAQEPEQYIVIVTISVVLTDRVKNQDIWSDERLRATATYSATEGIEAGDRDLTPEEEARQEAIAQLAEDVLARSLERW